MKLYIFCLLVSLGSGLGSISHAQTEPITIHGVNWSMPISKQIQSLEQRGLTCVREPMWNMVLPVGNYLELPFKNICIQSSNSTGTVTELRTLFAEWLQICARKENGYTSTECTSFDRFGDLRDTVRKAHYRDENTLIFNCNYIGSCGFDVKSVVSQIQKKVMNKRFSKPTENSYLVCADGDEGDSICVHTLSKDLWLLKTPILEKMRF